MSGLNRSTANQSKWGKGKAGPMMPDRTITGTIEAREIEEHGMRDAGSDAREIEARHQQAM